MACTAYKSYNEAIFVDHMYMCNCNKYSLTHADRYMCSVRFLMHVGSMM